MDPIQMELLLQEAANSTTNNTFNPLNHKNTECPVCKEEFVDEMGIQIHLQSAKITDDQFQCCSCKKIFKRSFTIKEHYRKHTGEKPFNCTICGKKFTYNANLNKHLRAHTGERRFTCENCGQKFKQLTHLEDHASVHTNERPYTCIHCNRSFKSRQYIIKHIRSLHSEEKSNRNLRKNKSHYSITLDCSLCGTMLWSRAYFKIHFATHVENKEGPYKCKMCGRKCLDYAAYEKHIYNHSKEKYLSCTECSKKYDCLSDLKRHQLTHLKVKPFKCKLCEKSFSVKENLKRHLMIHSGTKPFSCTICNNKYSSLANMSRHLKVHTGERPFKCDICDKSFALKGTLDDHVVSIHTNQKAFVCSECGQAFKLKKYLQKHTRLRHPSIPNELQTPAYIKIETKISDNIDDLRNIKTEPVTKTEEISICQDNIEFDSCFVKEENEVN